MVCSSSALTDAEDGGSSADGSGFEAFGRLVGAWDCVSGGSVASAIDGTGFASASVAVGDASPGDGDALSGMRVIATRAVDGSTVSAGGAGGGTVAVEGTGDGALVGTRTQPAATMASKRIATSRRPANNDPLTVT
jgi:hypothetical protein